MENFARWSRFRGVFALLLALSPGVAPAQPPIVNPSFEIVGPAGSPTRNDPSWPGAAGASAAASWDVFHDRAPFPTRTELVPTTLPFGGKRMIHVVTTAGGNGLRQVMGPSGTGSARVIVSAWVYVVRGTVSMGSGEGGGSGDAVSTTTGEWEHLQVPGGQASASPIVVSARGGGAEFFVDEVELLEIHDLGTNADRD